MPRLPAHARHLIATLTLGVVLYAPQTWALDTIEGAPEGFEQMNQPRLTSITVYYGGEQLGQFQAHFTPESVSFDDAAKLADAIPNLLNKEEIKKILASQMPANAEQLCNAHRTENCGMLLTENAGIIFDEKKLTAELFINKKYLSVADSNAGRYLPLPQQKDLSSVMSFSGAVNGMNGQVPNYSIGNNATVSMGEAMLNSDTTVSDNGLHFNTATVGEERNGWQAKAGLFRTKAMRLITDRDILGVAYASSTRTKLDQAKVRGNDVILYLPRRSFVSLYREGRLFSSRAYDAGNQQIDTSELPEGAYEITIKIQDSNGQVREERRFFAKTEDLPPPDSPLYILQAGVIRKPVEDSSTLPEVTDHPILRAGTSRRIADNIGLNISGLGLEDRAAAEITPFFIFNGARLSMTAMSSTKGDYGLMTSYVQVMGDFNLAADVRRTWASKTPMPGYEDQSESMTQATLTAGYLLTSALTIGLKSSYTERPDMPTMLSAGPYAQWNIWQRGDSMLIADATFSRTGDANEGNMMLRFSHKIGDYGVSGSLGQVVGSNQASPSGSVRGWHESVSPGERLLVGAGMNSDKYNRAVNADADWDNNFGQMRGGIQQSFGASGSNFSYGGNFDFNAAQLADEVHVGGNQGSMAAVIIETNGDANMPMNVKIDGVDRTTVTEGDHQVVYLPPFHTYRVRLSQTKAGFVDFGDEEQKVTLYPGNVVKLHWNINKFYVVVGKIVDIDGKPLTDAVLQEGNAQNATDDHGRIQAELSTPKEMNFTTNDNFKCKVVLPPQKETNGVMLYKQPLVCK